MASSLWRKIFQPAYHYLLALGGALWYRFPSRRIFVAAVTGTKGKTTTVEIISAILKEAGRKVALSSTLHFEIARKEEPNLFKMTMPGRFFMQKFLRRAVRAGCDYAVIEMTSEGAKQFRHKFIYLNALIFTNLAPEHIESHGSFEKYLAAKLKLARALEKSRKERKFIIANTDDQHGEKFLRIKVAGKFPFSLKSAAPYFIKKEGLEFSWRGRRVVSPLSGEFNLYNLAAASVFAQSQNIADETIINALEKFPGLRGRMEKITLPAGDPESAKQNFSIIVDYAHTPGSVNGLLQAARLLADGRLIVVLGCGGDRDRGKRPLVGHAATSLADFTVITSDNPRSEDPLKIISEIETGAREGGGAYATEPDRRLAIRRALQEARTGDVVVIAGKGHETGQIFADRTVPFDDAAVAREELKKILSHA